MNPGMGKLTQISISSREDGQKLRDAASDFAGRIGFGTIGRIIIATVALELAQNILAHAGSGEILLEDIHGTGIGIIAIDQGPGIPYAPDQFQSGRGLSAIRQLVDELTIEAGPEGRGARVTAKKWLR